MSDTSDWKGRRIGPYQIGERYLGVPEEEGQFHVAHHVETGEHALVVLPGRGEDWRNKSPWSVRTTHFTEPTSLILHFERLTQIKGPVLQELTLGFIRMAGALASLKTQKEARDSFLSESSPSHTRGRSFMRWGIAGAGVVLAAGLALWLGRHAPVSENTEQPSGAVARAAIDDPLRFTNGKNGSFPVIAYPMPEKPFKGQAKPPCIPDAEMEIRGACWTPHARTAPCPRSTAEYQGKCYVPVKREDPEPTSVQP